MHELSQVGFLKMNQKQRKYPLTSFRSREANSLTRRTIIGTIKHQNTDKVLCVWNKGGY